MIQVRLLFNVILALPWSSWGIWTNSHTGGGVGMKDARNFMTMNLQCVPRFFFLKVLHWKPSKWIKNKIKTNTTNKHLYNQGFSNSNQYQTHPGSLLKCRFWFSGPGVGLVGLHFFQAVRRGHAWYFQKSGPKPCWSRCPPWLPACNHLSDADSCCQADILNFWVWKLGICILKDSQMILLLTNAWDPSVLDYWKHPSYIQSSTSDPEGLKQLYQTVSPGELYSCVTSETQEWRWDREVYGQMQFGRCWLNKVKLASLQQDVSKRLMCEYALWSFNVTLEHATFPDCGPLLAHSFSL